MHIQADSELQAAANLIAKYSGFVIDWSRALEIPTCIEDLERVSYSSNYRIRKIKLTDIESKKFFIPVLAYEKNSNSPIILYCSGNRVFKERISRVYPINCVNFLEPLKSTIKFDYKMSHSFIPVRDRHGPFFGNIINR